MKTYSKGSFLLASFLPFGHKSCHNTEEVASKQLSCTLSKLSIGLDTVGLVDSKIMTFIPLFGVNVEDVAQKGN